MRKTTRLAKTNKRHGLSHLPEYKVWRAMIRRCVSPADCNYPNYGARGISVCERWMDFTAFLSDMGRRPSSDYSIDRIDNDGNYELGNCRWATRAEQNRNTRQNIRITHNGETKCLKEWADAIGLSSVALRRRLGRGWPIEQALTTGPIALPPKVKPKPVPRPALNPRQTSVECALCGNRFCKPSFHADIAA